MFVIRDPVVAPGSRVGAVEWIVQHVLRDARDLEFLKVTATATIVMFGSGAAMFAVDQPAWWQGILHLVLMFSLLDRFILMNHNIVHTAPFKKGFRWIGTYIEWGLMPFFGMTPRSYFAHHVGMHHLEGNGADDTSSTMRFQRDHAFHFARYLVRFLLWVIVDLSRYMARRRRYKLIRQMLVGELGCYLAYAALFMWKPWAALFVFIVPLVATRFLMMAGNWGQHAFIDAADPLNEYKNSITCINTRYNRRAFNDGYHIGHHLYARMHWTEMPRELERNRERYRAEGALIFEGIDFFMVWAFLMLRRYDWLAKALVSHPDLSIEERIALLRARTRPIVEPAPEAEPAEAVTRGSA